MNIEDFGFLFKYSSSSSFSGGTYNIIHPTQPWQIKLLGVRKFKLLFNGKVVADGRKTHIDPVNKSLHEYIFTLAPPVKKIAEQKHATLIPIMYCRFFHGKNFSKVKTKRTGDLNALSADFDIRSFILSNLLTVNHTDVLFEQNKLLVKEIRDLNIV